MRLIRKKRYDELIEIERCAVKQVEGIICDVDCQIQGGEIDRNWHDTIRATGYGAYLKIHWPDWEDADPSVRARRAQ